MTLTLWPMTSCSSRAIRLRSSATATSGTLLPLPDQPLHVHPASAKEAPSSQAMTHGRDPDARLHVLDRMHRHRVERHPSQTQPQNRRQPPQRPTALLAVGHRVGGDSGRADAEAFRRPEDRELDGQDAAHDEHDTERVDPSEGERSRRHAIPERLRPVRPLAVGGERALPCLDLAEEQEHQSQEHVERDRPSGHASRLDPLPQLASSLRRTRRPARGVRRSHDHARRAERAREPTVEPVRPTGGRHDCRRTHGTPRRTAGLGMLTTASALRSRSWHRLTWRQLQRRRRHPLRLVRALGAGVHPGLRRRVRHRSACSPSGTRCGDS